jgi:TatD DNase family protein
VLAAAGDVARYDEVVFCGFGEPLLRWDVVREVARALKARGARVRINTNGQSRLFLGRDILPEMAGVVDALSVSLSAGRRALRENLPPGRRGSSLRGRQGIHPRGAQVRPERHGEIVVPGVDVRLPPDREELGRLSPAPTEVG